MFKKSTKIGDLESIEARLSELDRDTALISSKLQDAKGELSTQLGDAVAKLSEQLQNSAEKAEATLQRHVESLREAIGAEGYRARFQAAEQLKIQERQYRDLMLILDRVADFLPKTAVHFKADVPIALDSDDHLKPWGAAHDNTRHTRFVRSCEQQLGTSISFLDLGCAGGGLVLDFILAGHRAFGIEGSDHPLRAQRAEWRLLKNNLFTADITRPFLISEEKGEAPILFDVISAWEVLEHIADADLPGLFANVKKHLRPGALFVGSIGLVEDHAPTGAQYHRTVQPAEWWERRFVELGLPMVAEHGFAFEDFARGTGNGPMDPNYRDNPEYGKHFVARMPSA